jgi:hypothetical protein
MEVNNIFFKLKRVNDNKDKKPISMDKEDFTHPFLDKYFFFSRCTTAYQPAHPVAPVNSHYNKRLSGK